MLTAMSTNRSRWEPLIHGFRSPVYGMAERLDGILIERWREARRICYLYIELMPDVVD